MWEHDIGALPIVDDAGRVIGMITDRDICMAAYTRGRTLAEIAVADVMSTTVVTCFEHASNREVTRLMADGQVHRIPVVNAARHVVGIVSLNDLALAMRRGRPVAANEIASTLAAVCEPRAGRRVHDEKFSPQAAITT